MHATCAVIFLWPGGAALADTRCSSPAPVCDPSVSVALVFTTTRRNEEELFLQTYQGSAALLKTGLEKGVSAKVQAASAFSKHYTGRFGGTGVWPNATIANFEDHSMDLLNLARGRAISFNPIIDEKNRAAFEAHAAEQAASFGAESLIKAANEGDRVVADGIYCVCKKCTAVGVCTDGG